MPPSVRGSVAQLGYVTRNLDRALTRYRDKHDVADFLLLEPAPGAAGPRVGLAYQGGVMIEIIEPAVGIEGVYATALPEDDDSAHLHHIAYVVEDLDTLNRIAGEYEEAGYEVPVNRDTGQGIWLAYVDTRRDMGHFTELLHLFDEGHALFGRVPGN